MYSTEPVDGGRDAFGVSPGYENWQWKVGRYGRCDTQLCGIRIQCAGVYMVDAST